MKRTPSRTKRQSRLARPRAASPAGAAPPAVNSKPAFVLRPAQRGDVVAVAALDERVTALPKPTHWLELYERQKKVGQPAGMFLVATTSDAAARFLGFIVGEIRAWEFGSAPCGWVYALSVDPDSRLLGVGEALLESIAREFRKAGVSKMRTMVARDNRLPMLFFRGAGMMAGPYIQLEKDLG